MVKECAAFSSNPELLSLLPFVESLEDNEAMTAHGLHCYSIIHDLKNKAVFDPAATTCTTLKVTTYHVQMHSVHSRPVSFNRQLTCPFVSHTHLYYCLGAGSD